MAVGDRIREARKAKGFTQKALGEACGIAEPTIRRYELGKLRPKMETLDKIAKALDTSFLHLIGEDEKMYVFKMITTIGIPRGLKKFSDEKMEQVMSLIVDAYGEDRARILKASTLIPDSELPQLFEFIKKIARSSPLSSEENVTETPERTSSTQLPTSNPPASGKGRN